MQQSFILKNKIEILLAIIILLYSYMIIINANFGVIDDHGLLNTILINQPMPLFIGKEGGRFYPLDGSEYTVISHIYSSATAFYIYNAVQLIITMVLLYKIMTNLIGEQYQKLITMSLIVLLFTPGFILGWLRLFVPERSEFFFTVLFFYFYLKYIKTNNLFIMVLAITFVNIAMYYKEPAFIMFGSFALSYLLLNWKNLNQQQKNINYLVIISAIVFIVNYFFIVFIHTGDKLYGYQPVDFIFFMVRNIVNFAINDPLIVFLVAPLTIYRLFKIIFHKEINTQSAIFDAMLISATCYFIAYLILKISSPYYLLPAYLFGIVPVIYLATRTFFYQNIIFKSLLIVSISIFIFNSLPAGLHYMSHYKNVPYNFQNTMKFLTTYINEQNNSRVSIFLDGVNRNGFETYMSWIEYLEFNGLNASQFDLKTDFEDNGQFSSSPQVYKDSKYTVLNQSTPSLIVSGDLLIVSPHTLKNISLDKHEIQLMQNEYDLIYTSQSFFPEIPYFGIKSIIKYLFHNSEQLSQSMVLSNNLFQIPLTFYVFRKKSQNELNSYK